MSSASGSASGYDHDVHVDLDDADSCIYGTMTVLQAIDASGGVVSMPMSIASGICILVLYFNCIPME